MEDRSMMTGIRNTISSLIELNIWHAKHSSLEECQETFSLIEKCQFVLSCLKANALEDKCRLAKNLMERIFKNASIDKIKKSKHINILEDEKTTSSLKSILDILFDKVQDKKKIDDRMLLYSAYTSSFGSREFVLEFFLKETPYMLAISFPFPDSIFMLAKSPDSISMLANQDGLSSQIWLGVSQVKLHEFSYNNRVDIDFDLEFLQDILAYYVNSGDINSFLTFLDDRRLKEIKYKDEDF